jgi:hypothetical protein
MIGSWEDVHAEIESIDAEVKARRMRHASLPWATRVDTGIWWIEGLGVVSSRPTKWMFEYEVEACVHVLECYLPQFKCDERLGVMSGSI